MDENTVIKVDNVSKKFTRSIKRTMLYGSADLFKSFVGIKPETQILRKGEFWSLKNISFELKKGETLGLIGNNGSGKSTLLRLLNGIFPPDKGKIMVKGKIGALIAVGAGFHPHLSGRENIYLNGAILGMKRTEIESKIESIIDFAEIGDFIDAPVSTYSSGMNVRLGFAIAIHADIDILLADEVLAVGDLGFQLKCFNKIGELRGKGVSTILVAHNMHTISTFCTSLYLLDKGEGKFYQDVEEGISAYKDEFLNGLDSEGQIEKVNTGTSDFIVTDVNFTNFDNGEIKIRTGEDIQIEIEYESQFESEIEIDTLIYLPIPFNVPFFQGTNKSFKQPLKISKGKGKLIVAVENINLNNFKGYFSISVWKGHRSEILFWWRNIPVKVKGKSLLTGWSSFEVKYLIKEK